MIEQQPGIMIYRHPNPEIRSYLTATEISTFRVEIFEAPLGDEAEDRLRSLGTIGAQAVRHVLSLPGVNQVEVKPRELRVKKDPTVSWDQIEPGIMRALAAAFRRKSIRLV